MSGFIKLSERLSQLCGIIAMILLAAGVFIVCEMIFIRYYLGGSTVWQTEFVTYALTSATFIGCPYVLLYRGHVGVDLLPNAASPAGKRMLDLLANILSMIFVIMLAWSSWHHFHEAWVGNWTTDTVWALPLWIPLLPLPIGMIMLAIQYVAEILKLYQPEAH